MQVVCVCDLLILAVLAVFGQTAHFDFVNYDDPAGIFENSVVEKGLSLPAVGWAFTHAQVSNWVPLTTLSHMLDCQLFGLHPKDSTTVGQTRSPCTSTRCRPP